MSERLSTPLLWFGLPFLLLFFALTGVARGAETGVVTDVTWGISRSEIDREIALVKQSGVKWIRASVNWGALEPNGPGRIAESTLADYDYAIDAAHAAGLEVVMPIEGMPYWASSDPGKYVDTAGERHFDPGYPPTSYAEFERLMTFVAAHFGARGVRVFELRNEPNTSRFWRPGPDPRSYVEMLRAGYAGVKAAAPGATVLLGGLWTNDFEYLNGIYASGGGAYFDAVAVHPYTPRSPLERVTDGAGRVSQHSFSALRRIRATMRHYGDRAPVWLTEFGYTTTRDPGGVSERLQARYLRQAYRYVERFRWVKAMLWYQARDNPYGDPSGYEANFGLATRDFAPKPSYFALKKYARRHR
jgi:hypothetical protein